MLSCSLSSASNSMSIIREFTKDHYLLDFLIKTNLDFIIYPWAIEELEGGLLYLNTPICNDGFLLSNNKIYDRYGNRLKISTIDIIYFFLNQLNEDHLL